jgi:hypothetical protein
MRNAREGQPLLWHLTPSKGFRVDAAYKPFLAVGLGRDMSRPALFLTDFPNYWAPFFSAHKELYAALVEPSDAVGRGVEAGEWIDHSPGEARVIEVLDIRTACDEYPEAFSTASFWQYTATLFKDKHGEPVVEARSRWLPEDGFVSFHTLPTGDRFVWGPEVARPLADGNMELLSVLLRRDIESFIHEKTSDTTFSTVGMIYFDKAGREAYESIRVLPHQRVAGDPRVEWVVPLALTDEDLDSEEEE